MIVIVVVLVNSRESGILFATMINNCGHRGPKWLERTQTRNVRDIILIQNWNLQQEIRINPSIIDRLYEVGGNKDKAGGGVK